MCSCLSSRISCPKGLLETLISHGSTFGEHATIEPGSPWENGYIESFTGKLRDEPLENGRLFDTLLGAKVLSRVGERSTTPSGGRTASWATGPLHPRRLGRGLPLPLCSSSSRPRPEEQIELSSNLSTGIVSGGRSHPTATKPKTPRQRWRNSTPLGIHFSWANADTLGPELSVTRQLRIGTTPTVCLNSVRESMANALKSPEGIAASSQMHKSRQPSITSGKSVGLNFLPSALQRS